MERYKELAVYAEMMKVGTLALYKGRLAAFEYSDEWLEHGFSISPLSLPLKKKVFIPKYDPFDGVFGVFWDSLPDGWGRLLVDRMLVSKGEKPDEIDPMMRLAIVGNSGMGMLSYKPEYPLNFSLGHSSYDELAKEAEKLLKEENADKLDELFALGASSGGARPKVLTKVDGEDWIVKFPSSYDPKEIGKMEYDYHLCAKNCGIKVPEFRLFESSRVSGYFGSKRFDRKDDASRVHMISASALLEVSHRVPALDYRSLLMLTLKLTNSFAEVEELYRRMCFNVFAHNRDDHSNNFSFLYENGAWRLAPAYDLTYSSSIGGEHATSVAGNGRDPGMREILSLAREIGIRDNVAKEIAYEIQQKVNDELGKYITTR